MSEIPHFHHALLRPCVIQILRAAGYTGSKPSVIDAFTDLAAKYLMTMATRTVNYAATMRNDTVVDIPDIRMAMQDLGALIPTMMIEDEIELPEGEDIRGVENFIGWSTGPQNKEIRRVALEGVGEGGSDYLDALMRKHDSNDGSDGSSRWDGSVLGKMNDRPREMIIEGGEITSIKEWRKENVRRQWEAAKADINGKAGGENDKEKGNPNDKDKTTSSTRQSSELSDLVEGDVEDVEMGDGA